MKPILIATARSGSTVIGELLGNLGSQVWNSKGYLGEFFQMDQNVPNEIIKEHGRLYLKRLPFVETPWCLNVDEEMSKRRQIIENDPNYVIKFLIDQISDWTMPWIQANGFTPIFVERRNKLKQVISFLAGRQTRKWYYHKSNTQDRVDKIVYNEADAIDFIGTLKRFSEFKNSFPNSPVVYYEDFMDLGGNLSALVKLLNVQESFEESPPGAAPTPYIKDSDLLISEDPNWLLAKDKIIRMIDEIK